MESNNEIENTMIKIKPIPKSQIGMSRKQKDILKSFVGKSPELPVELTEVREWEEKLEDKHMNVLENNFVNVLTNNEIMEIAKEGMVKYRRTLDKLSDYEDELIMKENENTPITKIKPIRPTVATFNSNEELNGFVRWAESTEKDNSPKMQKLREELKNHRRSKRLDRSKKIVDIAKEICDENDEGLNKLND